MEDEKPLLEVFEGAWDALPIYLFLKENGDGQYHLADLVRKSGYGRYRFKQMLNLLKEAGLIEYSLNRGSGLKLALSEQSQNWLNKVNIDLIRSKLANFKRSKLTNLEVGKRSKQSEDREITIENRLGLTSFIEELKCAPRALSLQPSRMLSSSSTHSDIDSSIAKQPEATQRSETCPTPIPQAETKQVAHTGDGPRQGAVYPESEDTPIKVKEIEQLWNELADETGIRRLEKIDSWSQMQVHHVLHDFPMRSSWVRAFDKIRESSFLKNSDWFGFRWILKENNFVKILEGEYRDGKNMNHRSKEPERSPHFRNNTDEYWENEYSGGFL